MIMAEHKRKYGKKSNWWFFENSLRVSTLNVRRWYYLFFTLYLMKRFILCAHNFHINNLKSNKAAKSFFGNSLMQLVSCNSSSCCGKPNEDGWCYIKDTDALIQNLTDSLAFLIDLKERNVSFDTYFISIPMPEWLLEKKLNFHWDTTI